MEAHVEGTNRLVQENLGLIQGTQVHVFSNFTKFTVNKLKTKQSFQHFKEVVQQMLYNQLITDVMDACDLGPSPQVRAWGRPCPCQILHFGKER